MAPTTPSIRKLTSRLEPIVEQICGTKPSNALVAAGVAHEIGAASRADLEAWIDQLVKSVRLAGQRRAKYSVGARDLRPAGYRPFKLPGALVMLSHEDAKLPTYEQVVADHEGAAAALRIASAIYLLLHAETRPVNLQTHRLAITRENESLAPYVVVVDRGSQLGHEAGKCMARAARKAGGLWSLWLLQEYFFAELLRQGLDVRANPLMSCVYSNFNTIEFKVRADR